MAKVARLGDTASHGGEIATASPDVTANGIGVARVGDSYDCPIHGANPIVTGSATVKANGRLVARVGDATACGAVITSGSPNVDAG